MDRRFSLRLALAASALAQAVGPAEAAVFVVGSGPGADFAGIAEAVASPLVQDGDVLLVDPGSYAGFQLDKALAILGRGAGPSAVVTGGLVVTGIATGDQATLSNLSFSALDVTACTGTVVLSGVRGDDLDLVDALDCRLLDVKLLGFGPHDYGLRLAGSKADLVGCKVQGLGGSIGGAEGFAGVFVDGSSSVRIAMSEIRGGDGGHWEIFFPTGGDGAPALDVQGEALISGPATALLGGDGGEGFDPVDDGEGGPAIRAGTGAQVRTSGAALLPGVKISTLEPGPMIEDLGAAITTPPRPDPSLELVGSVSAGSPLSLVAHGADGVLAAVYVGFQPLQLSIPFVLGDACAQFVAFVGTGLMGTPATLGVTVPVPPGLGPGFSAHFQMVGDYPAAGDFRLSNCVPVVVP